MLELCVFQGNSDETRLEGTTNTSVFVCFCGACACLCECDLCGGRLGRWGAEAVRLKGGLYTPG